MVGDGVSELTDRGGDQTVGSKDGGSPHFLLSLGKHTHRGTREENFADSKISDFGATVQFWNSR